MLIRSAEHKPLAVEFITYEDFKEYWLGLDSNSSLPLLWVKALAEWTIHKGEKMGHFYLNNLSTR